MNATASPIHPGGPGEVDDLVVSSLRSASMNTVSRPLSLSAPTVCASIEQLEASRLVTRPRSNRDRRAVEPDLTARGRRGEGRIWAQIGRLMSQAAEDLPAEDVVAALRVFRERHRRLVPMTPGVPA